MRRIALVATLAGALALAAPGLALAHGHHHHHHHARHHKAARTVIFTPTNASAPVTHTSTEEPPHAATVASFSGGVLVLTLGDGSTVKGLAGEQTEISCAPPGGFSARAADHGEGTSGDDGNSERSGDDGNEDQNAEQHESDDEGTEAGTCGTSALAPPALIREAELRIGPEGAVFERLVVVH